MIAFPLSSNELAFIDEHGYVGPFTLYQPAEMSAAWRDARLALLDRSCAVYSQDAAVSGVTNIANYDRHLDNDFLARHICRREIVDRVSSILGPDVICWRTEFFPKYPGDEGTDWHQADTFANASGKPQIVWPGAEGYGGTITVWAAFTEASVANGCLQFIPGTHRSMNYDESKGMQYRPEQINSRTKDGKLRGFFGYDYRELQLDTDFKPDESRAKSIVMRPGQFIIFWSTLMHASHPHNGTKRQMRMGFASRYLPSNVRVYPETDYVEEYGGRVSLERYGAVVVAGTNREPKNRIVTHTTRGSAFGEFCRR